MNKINLLIRSAFIALMFFSYTAVVAQVKNGKLTYNTPKGYMDEAKEIPSFWLATNAEVNAYIKNRVKKGKVEVCGQSAGGRPIFSVAYGQKRNGKATTTFSGAIGSSNIDAYRGAQNKQLVYMGIAGIHGFELEGIVGIINLIEVLETGKDLRGKVWPEINSLLNSIDRIVLIPLANPDGRERIPIKMEAFRGGAENSFTVHEYLNTGGNKDGTIIGWPAVKNFIPMKFSDFGFPGGYPNDAGVNIMHDDFFDNPQPETKALLNITAKEKPDLIFSMHTGVGKSNYYMQILRPYNEPKLQPVFDSIFRKIKTSLRYNNLIDTKSDIDLDPSIEKMGGYNLNTVLNLHCGALCITTESPSHSYSGTNRRGEAAVHTPDMLLDAQLIAHQEALKFLKENGGRPEWEKAFPLKK